MHDSIWCNHSRKYLADARFVKIRHGRTQWCERRFQTRMGSIAFSRVKVSSCMLSPPVAIHSFQHVESSDKIEHVDHHPVLADAPIFDAPEI